MIRRIGVLSGGGDCPGINAVIRAVVYAAVVEHQWEVIGIEDGYDGLLRPDLTRPLLIADVRGILGRGGSILGTTNRSNPFAQRVDQNGSTAEVDQSGEVLRSIDRLGLDAVVAIGGDGSLKITEQLYKLGAPVVGIPKTIDNDLSATDVTFGFHTALDVATDALDRLHTTAESHHRAMILEVMGRDTGWIALHSGLAGGAHVILIPEIPFDLDVVTEQVRHRDEQLGAKYSVIVVAEGCPAPGHGQILVPGTVEGTAPRLTGIGNWLSTELARRTAVETRATILGHIQRGGSPNVVDRILATRFGCEAVSLIDRGQFGQMVALRGDRIIAVPLAEAVDSIRRVPVNGQLVHNARQIGICLGDRLPADVLRTH